MNVMTEEESVSVTPTVAIEEEKMSVTLTVVVENVDKGKHIHFVKTRTTGYFHQIVFTTLIQYPISWYYNIMANRLMLIS